MAFKLVILSLAQKEIDTTLGWYESKQKGLGIDFITYLESYFLTLKEGGPFFK